MQNSGFRKAFQLNGKKTNFVINLNFGEITCFMVG